MLILENVVLGGSRHEKPRKEKYKEEKCRDKSSKHSPSDNNIVYTDAAKNIGYWSCSGFWRSDVPNGAKTQLLIYTNTN